MKTLWLPLLLSSVIWAEEDYFLISPDATWNEPGLHQSNGTLNDTGLNRYNTTWDEARNHCQACYKELATITSRNVHLIVQNLSLDYWTGLRRSYNGTIPWSRWSNGDPVTYQNWYPGHPLPNKVKKMIPICSSTTQSPLSTLITTTSTPVTNASTETPTETTTQTSTQTTTQTTTKTSTVTSPVSSPQFSTLFETNNTDVCPILYNVLECLNMTYEELERTVHEYSSFTPKTTTYSTTTNPTTYSTTTNPTTYSTTTNPTTFSTIFTTTGYETQNTTMDSTTTESTTASNCIFEPEPDTEVYIEDACLVLLSFGMWKEKNCNETLPFICYDERFFGQIDISNVNTSAGNVSWSNPPGNITHYKVEITWNQTKQTSNETDQYKQLLNLTPGNLYKVQVFPVKCGRDLNPQTISFYTKPSDIGNLTVVNVTTVTASLNWTKSEGDRDFYSVHIKSMDSETDQECKSEECTITGLTPGHNYTFTVTAIVNKITGSAPVSVSNYTRPSVVLNLTSTGKESTVITASWTKPIGQHSGYKYCLYNSSDCTNCNCPTNGTITTVESIKEENKTDSTMYCLCVAALTNNNTLSGEVVVIPAYTLPKSVTLSLSSTSTTITASWTREGNVQKFNLTIQGLTDPNLMRTDTTTNFTYTFTGLKPGVLYQVSVVTLNGYLSSNPDTESYYTAPTEPAWVKATSDGTTIHVTWGAPKDSVGAQINYTVTCASAFWEKNTTTNYTTSTEITFGGLNSGTRYTCYVSVVAGDLTSRPVTAHADTEPKKKTLTLTMLCSSVTPLLCENKTTQDELLRKLNDTFTDKFHDHVHWKLKWVDRNVINP